LTLVAKASNTKQTSFLLSIRFPVPKKWGAAFYVPLRRSDKKTDVAIDNAITRMAPSTVTDLTPR
ncbi:MAG: hypothetical protein WA777_03285, partial [Rhodanobacter sp.]